MTDRQAKRMWMDSEGHVQKLMAEIKAMLAEISQRFIFEPVTQATVDHLRFVVCKEMEVFGPEVRVELESVVQDSINFRFIHDRSRGQNEVDRG